MPNISMAGINTGPWQVGYYCRICGCFVALTEDERIAVEHGHQIGVFPVCDDCCAFIRKLKERELSE